jgi:CHASE2 domain-containing sensor protein
MKKHFWTEVTLATFLVFALMGGIYGILQLNFFNAFDSIGRALGDVDLTDYVFWGLRDDVETEENVVIVNIGQLSRAEIAEQIRILSKAKPRVIGIDSFFYVPREEDPMGDALLSNAIEEAGNVVLVTKIDQTRAMAKAEGGEYDSLIRSASIFSGVAFREGFANLETEAAYQDDVKTCRSFPPRIEINGRDNLAFAVVLASLYDSAKAAAFLERGNESELVNYRGNVVDIYEQSNENYRNVFSAIDAQQVLDNEFEEDAVKDKIVIMGYLGDSWGDTSWEDRFYTPLNTSLAGKANPDMFGVVIHANIVSMILNEEYLNTMAEWQEYAMAFILCFFNMALFWLIYHNLPAWYDGITKTLQIIQLLALTVLMVQIFHWFSFKLDITIALAAIAMAGDTFEIFEGVIKQSYLKLRGYFGFTKQTEEVLTP